MFAAACSDGPERPSPPPRPFPELELIEVGDGDGRFLVTVTKTGAEIEGFSEVCPEGCTVALGIRVIGLDVVAEPLGNSYFVGWESCPWATGTSPLVRDGGYEKASCTARFEPARAVTLDLVEAGDGDGTIEVVELGPPPDLAELLQRDCEEGCQVAMDTLGTFAVSALPVAKAGSHFVEWADCAFEPIGEQLDVAVPDFGGNDVESCTAVFELDTTPTAFAGEYAFPQADAASGYAATVDPTCNAVVAVGDQGAANPADGVDSSVTIVDLAAPLAARQVVVPGAQIMAASTLPDCSVMLGGESLDDGAWMGRLGPDDTFVFQVVLPPAAEAIYEMATGPGGVTFAAGQLTTDGTVFVAQVGDDGTIPAITTFDSQAFPNGLVATSDGGFAFTLNQFLGGANEAFVLRADASGAIVFQRHLTGDFASLSGVAETPDGRLVAWGRHGASGGTADGLVVLFEPGGEVAWQRTLGTGGAVRPSAVVPTPTGFQVAGHSGGPAVVIELDLNGSVVSTTGFDDSRGAANFLLGAGRTAGGGLAMCGSNAAEGFWTVIHTAPHRSLPGCADPGFGAALSPVTSAAGGVVILDGTIAGSSLSPWPTTPATLGHTASAQAQRDLCVE